MNYKKVLAVLALILVTLAVSGYLLFRWAVNPDNYRDQLETRLQNVLGGREVSMGRMELSILSGIGFMVDDVKVSDLSDKAETFISADRLAVRVKLIPLLKKRLSITGIEVSGPSVNLVRTGPESWNFSDLLEKNEESGEQKPPAEPGGEEGDEVKSIFIDKLVVIGGSITMIDRTDPEREPLALAVDRIAISDVLGGGPIELELKLGPAQNPTAIEIAGNIGPLGGKDLADRLAADLKGAFHSLDLAPLQAYLPPDLAPIQLKSGALSGDFSIKGGDGAPINAAANLTIVDFSYTNPDGDWPISKPRDLGLAGQAVYNRTDGTVYLNPATVTLGGKPIEVTALYSGLSSPTYTISGSAKARGVPIDALLDAAPVAGDPIRKSARLSGPLSADVSFNAVKGQPANITADLDLGAASIEVPGALNKPAGKAGRLQSSVIMGKESVDLADASITLGPLSLSGGGKIGRDDAMNSSLSFTSNTAPTNEVAALIPPASPYRMGGAMGLGLAVNGPLKDTEKLEIKVSDFRQVSDAANFILDATARLGKPVRVDFTMDAESLDVDRIKGVARGGDKSGTSPPASGKKVEGKESDGSGLAKVLVTGKINARKVKANGIDISDLNTSMLLENAVLKLPDFKMNALGGSIAGPMIFDLGKKSMPGDVSLNLDGFVVQNLIKRFTSFPEAILGIAQGNITLSFAGTSLEALKNTARGSAKIGINEGQVRGLDLVDSLINQWATSEPLKKVATASILPAIQRSVEESTPFQELDASVDLKSGAINVGRAVMDLPDGRASFTGVIGLDRTIKLTGELKLSQKLTETIMKEARKWVEKQTGGQVKGSLLDLVLLEDGRLVLPFTISGALPKPLVSFDAAGYGRVVNKNLANVPVEKVIENLLTDEQKAAVDKEKKKVEEQVEKEKKKLEEQAKEEAEKVVGEEGRKLLEGLFPK